MIEERKDIIAQDNDSAKIFSETELAIEELNMKLSEAKINSQSLMNNSFRRLKSQMKKKKPYFLRK